MLDTCIAFFPISTSFCVLMKFFYFSLNLAAFFILFDQSVSAIYIGQIIARRLSDILGS